MSLSLAALRISLKLRLQGQRALKRSPLSDWLTEAWAARHHGNGAALQTARLLSQLLVSSDDASASTSRAPNALVSSAPNELHFSPINSS